MRQTLLAVTLTGHQVWAVIFFAVAAILAFIEGFVVSPPRPRLLALAVGCAAVAAIFAVWPS